jgi:hypothetical protein
MMRLSDSFFLFSNHSQLTALQLDTECREDGTDKAKANCKYFAFAEVLKRGKVNDATCTAGIKL